jgi:hypothetical protein
MSSRIENQQISQTIPVHGLLSGASIGTWQADYPLTAIDFEYIKNGKPITFNWANSIFLATVGFGFNILGKGASTLAGIPQQIYIGEWITLGAGVFISIILYAFGLALPNDRKRVMKEIKEHFNNAPKHRQVVPGENE